MRKKFRDAFAGLFYAWRTQLNMWIHSGTALVVVIAGWYFKVQAWEWVALTLAITLVLMAEIFNTAIEAAIDIKTRQINPLARAAKDVAAGAVLVAALGAVVVGAIVFVPRLAMPR
ncbi:MAG: diacylglycerol kinase [Clostridia bacterium]|nr:diacylglycerol kinase [Clostridia bacterium]